MWNRWREIYPNIQITFQHVDFSTDGNAIDFSQFQFGDDADFSESIFGNEANSSGAIFGYGTEFSGATFGDQANFSDTKVGDFSSFCGATFGYSVDLSGATFGERINLAGATFGFDSNFSGASFGKSAVFSDAMFWFGADLSDLTFDSEADFSGAIFGFSTNFSGTTFHGLVLFPARSIDDWKESRAQSIDAYASLQSWSPEKKKAFVTLDEVLRGTGAGPDTFLHVDFSNARFLGFADFSGRKFKDRCDLSSAQFYQPPSFDSGDRLDRLDFYGAKIHFAGHADLPIWLGWIARVFVFESLKFGFLTPGWTTDSNVANQLRRLRDLADRTKNHDLERDLYIEERKAERGIYFARYWRAGWKGKLHPHFLAHCSWIIALGIYWLLADYGRTFVRPLAALVVSVFLFWWAYSAVLITPSKTNTSDGIQRAVAFDNAVWAFAISNAVPFVGALTLERDVKLTLLCSDRPIDAQHAKNNEPVCVPIPGRRFQLLALGQSIFSALCIFFAGLALRNYFKLR